MKTFAVLGGFSKFYAMKLPDENQNNLLVE
jgi:hypothetical protein